VLYLVGNGGRVRANLAPLGTYFHDHGEDGTHGHADGGDHGDGDHGESSDEGRYLVGRVRHQRTGSSHAARHVSGPIFPSTFRLAIFWRFRAAFSVTGP
jgi:hypothetical protein